MNRTTTNQVISCSTERLEQMLNGESWVLLDEIKTFLPRGTILPELAERFESMAAAAIPPSKDCWLELGLDIQKELDKEDENSILYCAEVALGTLIISNESAAKWLLKAKKLRAL